MESKWGYNLTQKASADLNEIVGYIAVKLSNPKAASDFVDKLEKCIDEIRNFPEIGTLVINDFMPNMAVRKRFVDNYIIYYLPDNTAGTIYILRIIYSKRNMDEILQQLNI